MIGILGHRRAHRADAAEEEVRDDGREIGMAQLALGLEPGEHPVHHAEEQHRQGLLEPDLAELGPHRRDRVGESGDDAALGAEDAFALRRVEEAHVLGEDAVLGLRAGIDGEEGVDQPAQARLGRERHAGGDVGVRDAGEGGRRREAGGEEGVSCEGHGESPLV